MTIPGGQARDAGAFCGCICGEIARPSGIEVWPKASMRKAQQKGLLFSASFVKVREEFVAVSFEGSLGATRCAGHEPIGALRRPQVPLDRSHK
jgi:hypothetical protein